MNGWWKEMVKENKKTGLLNKKVTFDPLTKMNGPLWFILPYWILFFIFIVIPVIAAVVLSFTYFNAIQTPKYIGITIILNLLVLIRSLCNMYYQIL